METSSSYASDHFAGFLGEDSYKEIQESQKTKARQLLIGKKREGGVIKDALNEFCRTAKEDLGEDKIPADDIIVVKGNVVDTSLEIAEAKDCDIIVMGQHTRTSLEEAFQGSTTWQLLRRSRIPILLVPLPVEE